MYLVIMQGHEVLRTKVAKEALAKFNALRRELEAQILEVGTMLAPDDGLTSVFAFLQTLKPIKHQLDYTEPPTYCRLCKQKHGFGRHELRGSGLSSHLRLPPSPGLLQREKEERFGLYCDIC